MNSKDLKGELKAVEEKEYTWAVEGDDGIIELLLDAKETVARLNRVLRSQERARRRPFSNDPIMNNDRILTLK